MFKLLDAPQELDEILITEKSLNGKIMQEFLDQQDNKGLAFMGLVGGKFLFKKKRIYPHLKCNIKESKP